jgi:hypothetical protein
MSRARICGPAALRVMLPLAGLCVTMALAWDRQPAASAAGASSQSIAVPAYFSPGSEWTKIDHADPPVRLAVMNPDNGPGSSRAAGFAHAVRGAQSAGITVVGYVSTDYAQRPLTAVEADVDAYYRWYGVNGIFFDQATTGCAEEPYYAALNRYVKGMGGAARTILNPGTQTSQCYVHAADILVTFEGSDSEYLRSYSGPAWVAHYSPRHFWHLIYSTPTVSALAQVIRLSRRRHAGFVYVTGAGLPNPYGGLPNDSYWAAELADVAH